MKIFGFEIHRVKKEEVKPELEPEMRIDAINVDDWLHNHQWPDVEFDLPYTPPKEGERVQCKLSCKHNGNTVIGRGIGENSLHAMQKAVVQIEETIGSEWRAHIPVTVIVQEAK